VQLPLDPPSLGVSGGDDAGAGEPQLLDPPLQILDVRHLRLLSRSVQL